MSPFDKWLTEQPEPLTPEQQHWKDEADIEASRYLDEMPEPCERCSGVGSHPEWCDR